MLKVLFIRFLFFFCFLFLIFKQEKNLCADKLKDSSSFQISETDFAPEPIQNDAVFLEMTLDDAVQAEITFESQSLKTLTVLSFHFQPDQEFFLSSDNEIAMFLENSKGELMLSPESSFSVRKKIVRESVLGGVPDVIGAQSVRYNMIKGKVVGVSSRDKKTQIGVAKSILMGSKKTLMNEIVFRLRSADQPIHLPGFVLEGNDLRVQAIVLRMSTGESVTVYNEHQWSKSFFSSCSQYIGLLDSL